MTCRVVVTGGGGFVGRGLCEAFVQAGWQVLALDQNFDRAPAAEESFIQIKGPLNLGFRELAISADLVIHAAAITAAPEDLGISVPSYIALNTESLTTTLCWAREHAVPRFVYLSSTGVFSAQDGETELIEDTTPGSESPYARAKRAGETIVKNAASFDFQTLSLRLGYLFGPSESARQSRPRVSLAKQMMVEAQADGLIKSGAPNARRDWTYLPDLGQAVVALCDHWPDQTLIHAGTPPRYSDMGLAKTIASLTPPTRIDMTAGVQAVKPPMASRYDTVFTRMTHTPLQNAIRSCLNARCAP